MKLHKLALVDLVAIVGAEIAVMTVAEAADTVGAVEVGLAIAETNGIVAAAMIAEKSAAIDAADLQDVIGLNAATEEMTGSAGATDDEMILVAAKRDALLEIVANLVVKADLVEAIEASALLVISTAEQDRHQELIFLQMKEVAKKDLQGHETIVTRLKLH